MKPSMAQMLMGVASTLTRDIAPHLENTPAAIGQVGTIGLILACIAQEADRAAETALREQDALRALFADAAESQLPEDLRQRLRGAALDDARPSLKIADLEPQNAALAELLGELLRTVEELNFDWAEKLETRIWRLLKAGADRRALYLPVL
jgi:hypothetical protein